MDFHDAATSPGTLILQDGIKVAGWNIWDGGATDAMVPKAYADSIEKLLGKRGCINDRHSLAALDTINKIRDMRTRISTIRASWDEAAMMSHLIARSIVGYALLVGTPSPLDLHVKDTPF